jgi:hypothetical protein
MAEIRTVTTLTAKRDEILRMIESYEAKLDQARADLSHINAVLTIFQNNPDELLDYKPYSSVKGLFRHGEMARLCREALKDGEKVAGEIARYIIEAKGLDQKDGVILKTLSLQVTTNLNSQMQRGNLKCIGWRKINKRKPVRVWALP